MVSFGLFSSFLVFLLVTFQCLTGFSLGDSSDKSLKPELYKLLSKLVIQSEWSNQQDGVRNFLFPSNDQVERSLLFNPTFEAQAKLCESYLAATSFNENDSQKFSGQVDNAFNEFLESLSKTSVFQSALDYLKDKGYFNSKSTEEALKELWSSEALRSSFCRAKKGEASEVSGGNWLAFYLAQSKRLDSEQDLEVVQEKPFEESAISEAVLQKIQTKFAKRKGGKLENEEEVSLLAGTTPEFELAAFTVCSLAQANSGGQNTGVKKCKFAIDKFGNEVKAVVSTSFDGHLKILDAQWDVGNDQKLSRKEADVHVEDRGHKKKNKTVANDPELQKLVDKMWIADSDDRVKNGTVKFDWGKHVDGEKDMSPNKLFNNVSEEFMKRPLYSTLIGIYNQSLFHRPVCVAEPDLDDRRHAVLDNFLNVVTNTSTFKLAYDFLKSRNLTGSDYATFRKTLFNLWFGGYTRCDGTIGSSGWEHVFSGEWKDTIVDGHHNWVRFYMGEKAGEIDYHGYYVYKENLIGTIQYKWKNQMKKIGGFLVLTSPAFDFSLFTVCSITHVGNEKCRFTINGNKLFVSSFKQTCTAGTCLSTSYPGIKGG